MSRDWITTSFWFCFWRSVDICWARFCSWSDKTWPKTNILTFLRLVSCCIVLPEGNCVVLNKDPGDFEDDGLVPMVDGNDVFDIRVLKIVSVCSVDFGEVDSVVMFPCSIQKQETVNVSSMLKWKGVNIQFGSEIIQLHGMYGHDVNKTNIFREFNIIIWFYNRQSPIMVYVICTMQQTIRQHFNSTAVFISADYRCGESNKNYTYLA